VQFGAFAAFGFLEFGGEPSRHETYYRAMIAALSDPTGVTTPYDLSEGTHMEGSTYARAAQLAAADGTLTRAGNERHAYKSHDLLPLLEADYDIVPPPNATLQERRVALSVRMRAARGGRRENIVASLREALGDEFIAFVESKRFSPQVDAGLVNCNESTGAPKYARLTEAVPYAGIHSIGFTFEMLTGETLQAGDVVTVQGENTGCSEKVTLLTVSGNRLNAAFTKAHDAGATVSTARWVSRTSTTRHVFAIVRDAYNSEVQRLASQVLSRLVRATDTWAIVQPSQPGTVGPFLITSRIGCTSLGEITYDGGDAT